MPAEREVQQTKPMLRRRTVAPAHFLGRCSRRAVGVPQNTMGVPQYTSSRAAGLPWQMSLQIVRCCRTVYRMEIWTVRHRGLRELLERNSTRLLRQDLVGRIRNVVTALVLAENMESFRSQAPPGWRIHRLSGERENDWSISVSSNWRITFEEKNGKVERLNLEDYH